MVCRPAKAFNFYSGHPDVCTANNKKQTNNQTKGIKNKTTKLDDNTKQVTTFLSLAIQINDTCFHKTVCFWMGGGGGGGGESRCKGFPCSCFTKTTINLRYHLPAHTINMEHPRLQIRSLYCSIFIIENFYRQYMIWDRRTGLNMVEWKAVVETRQLQIKPGRTNPHISRARKKKTNENDLILRPDIP